METREAILAFSQSEKIKAGLIWASQLVEMYIGLPENEKAGAEKIIGAICAMIDGEIHIAQKATGIDDWKEIGKSIDTALIMINSGVTHESSYHFTQALSRVTGIGQKSMTELIDQGYL